MNTFFSFVTMGDGYPIYTLKEDRKKLKRKSFSDCSADNHCSIIDRHNFEQGWYLNGQEQKYNKYRLSYENGKGVYLYKVEINAEDDSEEVANWATHFIKLNEFADLIIQEVAFGNLKAFYFLDKNLINESSCLDLIKINPEVFIYFPEEYKTIKLFNEALKEDGLLLGLCGSSFAKLKTPENCLTAVKQNGMAIDHISIYEQTPEICMAAVQQNGLALKHIYKPTEELCLAAVKNNGFALKNVNKEMRTKKIIKAAIGQNPGVLTWLTFEEAVEATEEFYLAAVQSDGNWINKIDRQFVTEKIRRAAEKELKERIKKEEEKKIFLKNSKGE